MEQAERVSRTRVIRLMPEEDLKARVRKRYRCTTMSDHDQPVAANRLNRQFTAEAPNQRWVGDTTEFVIGTNGKLYLAAILDLFSRVVVGWAVSAINDRPLTIKALEMALTRRGLAIGLLHHSDQGCTYASADYQKRLAARGITCSMSRRGNCYDNAVMEAFFSSVKGRQGHAQTHDGTIVTREPNLMWGTDGVRVFTVDDGWVWTFAAVEPWNAECVGWYVCKVGSRFAALEPIAQGLRRLYGSVDAEVARGLALRMAHGSQYLSDHFLNQIRYWGIRPSYGFIEEPETNGVAGRWNRTLKEQAIHGRIFQTLEAVRAAGGAFVEQYNTTWRLEKLGYQTPIEARQEHELRQAA